VADLLLKQSEVIQEDILVQKKNDLIKKSLEQEGMLQTMHRPRQHAKHGSLL
jgi:hypothetical protein